MNQSFEKCDDGFYNSDTPDKCRTNCSRPRCGDSIVDSGEKCDDGNSVNTDNCSNSCTFNVAAVAYCGDRLIQAGEQCDDGNNLNNDGCSSTCLKEGSSLCGNGQRNPGEECDDANLRNGDGCSSLCLLERGSCGDRIVQVALGETCDDGNLFGGDGCVACKLEAAPPTAVAFCGDGVLQPDRGEQCDDGQRNGFGPSMCRPTCLLPLCGDAVKDYNEVCDDGNRLDGDGCNAFCQREQGGAFSQPPAYNGGDNAAAGQNAGQNGYIPPTTSGGPGGGYYQPQQTSGGPGTYQPPYGQVVPTPHSQPGSGPGFVIFLASGAAAGVGLIRKSLKRRIA